jgi:hypothetical protein
VRQLPRAASRPGTCVGLSGAACVPLGAAARALPGTAKDTEALLLSRELSGPCAGQVAARAATAAGHMCLGDGAAPLLAAAADALLATATTRAEPVHFAAGEALCCVFGGAPAALLPPAALTEGRPLASSYLRLKVMPACCCTCPASSIHASWLSSLRLVCSSAWLVCALNWDA